VSGSTASEKLETKRSLVRTTRPSRTGDAGQPHHLVRVPKGAKPVTVDLTSWQKLAWRRFGAFVQARGHDNPELEENLLRARIKLRPEEYFAVAWMTTTIAFVAGLVGAFVAVTFLLLLKTSLLWIAIIGGLAAALPPVLAGFLYFGFPGGILYRGMPAGRAKKRGHLIDRKITGAMSFISAMASADVPVDTIFRELSKQSVYGEVAKEAEWITRDTELLGLDILTALRTASGRSPSPKFQDFLQGVVTTSTSGGQLKPYFLMKAEQFEKEDRLEMRKRMETLGMLAESFVTVVVAFPLFLVVIMAIMALISRNSSGFVLQLLFVVVGLMIPMSQFGFIFVIWNMEQEGG